MSTVILFVTTIVPIVAIILLAGNYILDKERKALANSILGSNFTKSNHIPTPSTFTKVPYPVQRYLEYSKANKFKKNIRTIVVKQKGLVKKHNKGRWRRLNTKKYLLLEKPEFIQLQRLNLAVIIWEKGWEYLFDGKSNRHWRLFGVFKSQEISGDLLTHYFLTQYIANMPWYPTGSVPGKYLSWQPINDYSAQATISYNDIEVSAVFKFHDEGDIQEITSDTYHFDGSNKPKTCSWVGKYSDYKRIQGVKVPTKHEARWVMQDKGFTYLKTTLKSISFI